MIGDQNSNLFLLAKSVYQVKLIATLFLVKLSQSTKLNQRHPKKKIQTCTYIYRSYDDRCSMAQIMSRYIPYEDNEIIKTNRTQY